MPYSPMRPGKFLFSTALILLVAGSQPADCSPLFFKSAGPGPHIFPDSPLYLRDTVRAASPGILHIGPDGDLLITVPLSVTEKYRLRFYNEENIFLFEIRQIRDPLLIVEKYNFGHAGWFHYELYRDTQIVERSRFQIKD